MVTLLTDRLIIRQFRENDWKAIHKITSHRAVYRYVTWTSPTEKEIQNYVLRQSQPPSSEQKVFSFVACLKSENTIIGVCQVYVRHYQNQEGEIEYFIDPSYWGEGYATEAAMAQLHFAFRHLKLHRVYATCDPRNAASRRVLDKIGMKFEGHFREHKRVGNRWRDSLCLAILNKEWKTLKNQNIKIKS